MMAAFVVFPLVLLVIPGGIGLLLIPSKNKAQIYVMGLCASWSLYEILLLLFHIALWPLHVMTLLWLFVCAIGAGSGYYRNRSAILQFFRKPNVAWPRGERWLMALLVVLVLAQALSTAVGAYYGNWDDSTYCGIATTSWYTDTVNRYSPDTGDLQPAFFSGQYVLAGWPVFSASLAQLTGIHPAIVFRTILPLFEVFLAYFVLYLLARFFSPDNRKKALCTGIVAVIVTLVVANRMPQTSAEWWLVINPWTGKSIACNIMVPMILWILFQIETTVGTPEQRSWWCSLFLTCFTSCFIAGTMFFLAPVELAVWGIFYLLRSRRWKDFFKFLLCALPAVACCLVVYGPIILSWL